MRASSAFHLVARRHFGFAAGAQIGDGLGELFGVGIKLLDDGGLAGFHFGQLFLLIIGQADGVLARLLIALERLFQLGLGLGLLRGQFGQLVFAVGFLLLRWPPIRR